MAPTYKVEELLAVRGSVSESAVSLEKFADEDAIKQHVLRPSASATGFREKAENTAPLVVQSYPLGANYLTATPKLPAPEIDNLKRTSPSPSVKKAKAERLLKEHGSPPGRRVTAGGRIVPTDWTWSGNHAPPYPYGRFFPLFPYQRPYLPFMPGAQPLGDLPNGFVGYSTAGKLCQIVDGETRELKDGQLFMAAPNMPFPIVHAATSSFIPNGAVHSDSYMSLAQASADTHADNVFLGLDKMSYEKQIEYLDCEMRKTKFEHNKIERDEVVLETTLSPVEREKMVCSKRALVLKMDSIRKVKKSLENLRAKSLAQDHPQEQAAGAHRPAAPNGYVPQTLSPPHLSNGFPHGSLAPFPPSILANAPYTNAWHGFSMPESDLSVSAFAPEVPNFVPYTANSPHGMEFSLSVHNGISVSPDSAAGGKSKRSHAVPIKAPPAIDIKRVSKTTLDPTSPTYEPAHIFVPPSPSPIDSPAPHPVTQHTWLNSKSDSSDSSVSTTNFFPNDAAEHSQRKHTFARPANAAPGAELSAFSGQVHDTTPQKDWVRNSQMVSQTTSPERHHSGKGGPISPVDTRISSWTQDILPMFESASLRQSPELARNNGLNALNSFSNGAHGASTGTSPLKNSIGKGKSLGWCEGYMSGSRANANAQPDINASNEFKAGFYQGMADHEEVLKRMSKQATPDHVISHRSSARDIHNGGSNGTMFTDSAMHDSVVNLPLMMDPRLGTFRYPHTGDKIQYPTTGTATGVTVSNGFITRASTSQGFSGIPADFTTSGINGSDRRIFSMASEGQKPQRGYSEGAATAMQTPIPPAVDNDSGPFLWKEQHLRDQQIASILKPLGPSSRSGNQLGMGDRVTSGTFNNQRYVPALKTIQLRSEPKMFDPVGTKRRPENVSHFDGATDDLAELNSESFSQQGEAAANSKATPSPSKDKSTTAVEATESSGPSPKKSNTSPSKAKEVRNLVASTARRMLKGNEPQPAEDDPSKMDPKQKDRHREQWRKRFQKLKTEDQEAIRKNRAERNKP